MRRSFIPGASVMLLASCGYGPTGPRPTGGDSLTLVTISPPLGTTLQRGQTITLTATLSYSLASADSGAVQFGVEDQALNQLSTGGTEPIASVSKGSGQVTLSRLIALPQTGISSLTLSFDLLPPGPTNSQKETTPPLSLFVFYDAYTVRPAD
jgi:hypothetical protein